MNRRLFFFSRRLFSLSMYACILSLISSCEDEIQPDNAPLQFKEEMVEVTLQVGVEEPQDAYDQITPQTRATQRQPDTGFCAELIPSALTTTRAALVNTPDQLYNLEIGQYEENGNRITHTSLGNKKIGEQITVTLSARTKCQLLVVVRGSANFLGSIGTNSLSGIRSGISTAWSNISNLKADQPTQVDINKMPYVLLLENVTVTSDGKITSPDGVDVRLLLKRLAARVTVTWDFSISGYTLKEASLQQVPRLYRMLPTQGEKIGGVSTYPGLLDEYVDVYRMIAGATEDALPGNSGSRTVWVPANVRGVMTKVVSPSYRSKYNAPTGAMFAEFRAEKADIQSRLLCRVYIGGNSTSDFNVRENTDYTWNVTLSKGDPVEDERITQQSLAPVRSENLVNTLNCFMIEPGGDICFNPYKHKAGTAGWNDWLVSNPATAPSVTTPISYMKLVWQTKDAATTGDLVMGYVVEENNHTNLIDITDGGDLDKARVHVTVPVTKGGNAVIAACDVAGNILWSWHLWITGYVPKGIDASTSYAAAQDQTKEGTVHQYATTAFREGGLHQNKVTMDRNLGATGGGFPGKDASDIEFAKRYGVIYEYGRKDPTFNSVDGTSVQKNIIFDGFAKSLSVTNVNVTAAGVLKDGNALEYSIRHPLVYLSQGGGDNIRWWYANTLAYAAPVAEFWNKNGSKAMYDPCPEGWMVPHNSIWSGTNNNNAYWFNSNKAFATTGKAHAKGGRLYRVSGTNGAPSDNSDIKEYCWFPVTGFKKNGAITSPTSGYLWAWNTNSSQSYKAYFFKYDAGATNSGEIKNGVHAEGICTRCVQE